MIPAPPSLCLCACRPITPGETCSRECNCRISLNVRLDLGVRFESLDSGMT